MLWFNHPKQVGSRRPVAMLIQRQSDKPTAVYTGPYSPAAPEAQLKPSDAGIGPDAAAAVAAPLDFSVRYALPEYVGFMWQHGGYLIRRRQIGFAATYYMLAKSTAAAALHFVLQGRSRHAYQFTVDGHGIIRTSPSGVTLIPWADVSAIRTYSRGFMMVLKRGTLPIPYRCLDSGQTGALRALAAAFAAPSTPEPSINP